MEEMSTWYRSVDENGFLICESSDVDEVLAMSKGSSFTVEVMTKRVVTSRWKAMDPNEVAHRMRAKGI